MWRQRPPHAALMARQPAAYQGSCRVGRSVECCQKQIEVGCGRRPAHPFTKLLLPPVALFASLDWEIGRNRAKFIVSRACCRPLGGALHGRQEELT